MADTGGEMTDQIIQGDCLDILSTMPDDSADLVFTSPPYEDCRTYGIGFKLKGQDWVDWAVDRFLECCRVCKGLTAWVVEGRTRQFRWSATPALLMADLHRAGVKLRKPPIFHRVGVPGSGGPDWLRNDYEFIVCASKGKLPWSDNTACGHPPLWGPGGAKSHRTSNGGRVNQWGHPIREDGKLTGSDTPIEIGKPAACTLRPSHKITREYDGVTLANPGNVVEALVGGGVMGDSLCHENEAPFPEDLAAFFIKSFCPPGGLVLDPFCGSGTTCAVANGLGRHWLGIDIRQSQVELSNRRIHGELFHAAKEGRRDVNKR